MGNIMNDKIMKALLAVIPELFSWIKHQLEVNGRLPTEEELQAHLEADEDKYINRFNAWLEAHKDE